MSASIPGAANPNRGAGRSHLAYILILAMAVRLLTALLFFHFRPAPPLDQWGYENIAIAFSLHSGHGYSSPFFVPTGPTAMMAPGYPCLLAAAISILGTGSIAATILIAFQIALSLLTIPLVMFVARTHFDATTANLAGFICAVCPPLFFQSLFIWDTTLSALLLIATVAIAPLMTWSRAQSAAAGAGLALAVLLNPSLLPPLLALLAWSAWRRHTMPWLSLALFLIVLSPWPIRNALVLHSFIPLRSNFGFELWAGNHAGRNGELTKYETPVFNSIELQQYTSQGEVAYMRGKRALAKTYIAAHPGEFARSCGGRVLRFWAGTAGYAPAPATPSLSILGIGGLALLWRRRQTFVLFALPLALFPLIFYITHAEPRFLSVISPVLVVPAAYACYALLKLLSPQSAQQPEASANTLHQRTIVSGSHSMQASIPPPLQPSRHAVSQTDK